MKSRKPTRPTSAVEPTARPNGSPAPSTDRPSAPAHDRSPYAGEHDIVETAAGVPRLATFTRAVDAAGLKEMLEGVGPFTVFAPTDRAFEKIPRRELDALLADEVRLANVLRHHVIAGRVKAPKPALPRTAAPHYGDELRLTSDPDAYRVDEAKVVKTNIRASNGVIHAIDTVLMSH